MMRFMVAVAAVLVLSACSTTIVPTQEMSAAARSDLKVASIKANVASGVEAPTDLDARLEQAVQKAIAAKNPSGRTDAKVAIVVTRYEVVSGGARALMGALAGANKLYASVSVSDAHTGATIGKFNVERDSNPGGYGMFYDQAQATIDAAAEGIVDGLYGTGEN